MKLLGVGVAFLIGGGLAGEVAAQANAVAALPRAKVITAAREIMTAVRYGTLVTIGVGGQPQARIVDAFAPDSALTVWIATNPATRKVAEITRDSRVTLMYFSPSTFEYVTLIGTAVLDSNATHKAAHWKPDWARLYKDEYRGADYLLIKVTPSRIEVVSTRRGIANDPVTWRPVSVDLP